MAMCKSNKCAVHSNASKVCSTPFCNRPLIARGLCGPCYDRARTAGSFGSGEKCEELSCQRKKSTEKFCHTCYKRHLSRMKGVKPLKVRGKCTISGCNRQHHSHGFCRACLKLKQSRTNGSKPKKFFGKSLLFTHPHIAKLMVDQSLPSIVSAGSAKFYEWVCPIGHPYTNTVKGVIRGDGKTYGCAVCRGKKVVIGVNDLATVDKELARFLCNIEDGKSVTIKSKKVLMWECGCRAPYPLSVQARVMAKETGNTGCPRCSKYGHDRTMESFFYLVNRSGHFKIGIMNTGTSRLRQHGCKGWSVVEKIMMEGDLARGLETMVKRLLKKNGIPTGSKAFREKFDGYSEAWNSADLDVTSIDDLLKKLGTSFEAILAA